jgi:chromosome segregation ATPase
MSPTVAVFSLFPSAVEKTTRNLSWQLSTAQSKSTSLYFESRNLQTDLSVLQSSKSRLGTELEDQNRRVAVLQTQIQKLNTQVAQAQVVLIEAGELDKSIDPLYNQVRELRSQLLDVKQKLDGLKAALEEKKDGVSFLSRRRTRLTLDKKARNEMMSLLAETAEAIRAQITHVEDSKW